MDTSLRFLGDLNAWIGALLAVALAAGAWFLYRRETRDRADRLRWLLPTLRALAVFLIVLALTGPVLHHERVIRELGRLFVFIDGSGSMEVADDEMPLGRKAAAMQREAGDNSAVLAETLGATREIRAFNLEEMMGKRFLDGIGRERRQAGGDPTGGAGGRNRDPDRGHRVRREALEQSGVNQVGALVPEPGQCRRHPRESY